MWACKHCGSTETRTVGFATVCNGCDRLLRQYQTPPGNAEQNARARFLLQMAVSYLRRHVAEANDFFEYNGRDCTGGLIIVDGEIGTAATDAELLRLAAAIS